LREAVGETFPELIPKPGSGASVEMARLDLFDE
jgi:hypothetical protein